MTDDTPDAPQFLSHPDGYRLAYRMTAGTGPTIVFLPGYLSDMEGGKATAVEAWAKREGRAMLRFDYSGCGSSEGDFETATLTRWRDDVLLLIDSLTSGPLLLVGSSMGGWVMLLVALARPDRVAGLVGIAAAPDFTDWGFTQAEKIELLGKGRIERPSDYGDAPTPTTRAFWQSGEGHRLLQLSQIPIDCPVRLLHGQRDPDVPWHHSLHLAERVRSGDVQTLLVKDGDHRLSRPQDIILLLAAIAQMLETP